MNGTVQRDPSETRPRRVGFAEDFRRFFVRGMAALLPTLITLWLITKAVEFLWENLGRRLIWLIALVWPEHPAAADLDRWYVRLAGVALAVVLVYIVGLFVGNFIGRAAWHLAETALMRVPLIRAVYPAVKQVTDFILADRRAHLQASSVVAVQPHENGIWSVGLVTGPGLQALSSAVESEMVTVFIPSSPTAFSGYMVLVPRDRVVELPMKVEEAMRLLVTGGVSAPPALRGSDQKAADQVTGPGTICENR